jgi:hypothetical protein
MGGECIEPLPNFVIIGAHRAGTTAVYRYCQEHPQIYMSPIKETNFLAFDADDAAHVGDRAMYPVRSLEQYRDQFRGASSEHVIGEASPNYLYSEIATRRIKCLLPDACLLLMLRNPIHRLRSMYLAQARDGRTRQTWQDAISDREWLQRHAYFHNASRYVCAFGMDRLKVMLNEDLEEDPAGFFRDLFDRLGVDASFRPNLEVRHNKGGTPKLMMMHRLGTNKSVAAIARSIVPRGALDLAKSVLDRNLQKAPPMSDEEILLLKDAFREDSERLGQLLGLDLVGRWGMAG